MLVDLNADNIGDLDEGRARALVNHALATLMKDLDDRGEEDGKPRSLKITLTFVKDRGNAVADVQVSTTMPAYRSNNTVGKMMQKKHPLGPINIFAFQEHDAENPDQNTLEFGEVPNDEKE